jgi:SAM-dependent methyltransferase
MAGSFPIFDRAVHQLISWIAPTRALDLGAGAGKYGRMIGAAAPGCERVAVEISEDYVARYDLPSLYERVDLADVSRWWLDHPEEAFDLVIIGDCLEHLPKSAGLDLLNAMMYRCGWLVALVPEFIIQGAVDGAASEIHRSVWSERDLIWHDLWAWDNARAMCLLVLRGYRPSTIDIDAVVHRMNAGVVELLDFDGQSTVRPCRLRLVDQGREVAYRPR